MKLSQLLDRKLGHWSWTWFSLPTQHSFPIFLSVPSIWSVVASPALWEEWIPYPALMLFKLSSTDPVGPEAHVECSVIATEFQRRGSPKGRAWLLVSGAMQIPRKVKPFQSDHCGGVWCLWLGLCTCEKSTKHPEGTVASITVTSKG